MMLTGGLTLSGRLSVYPGAESNCYLKFRKLLFYPLNYRGDCRCKVNVSTRNGQIIMTGREVKMRFCR